MDSRKVPATITYQKTGTQPPLFVAGSFSDPQWEPQEMEYTTDGDGEHHFKKDILVDPSSEVQYKFRIGSGDWWILDEDASTVTDELGNRNNILKPLASQEKIEPERKAVPREAKPRSQLLERVTRPELDLGGRSGASTPGFARTAAEVADSAALLDVEPPEPDISDGEAGRIGFRRMSATPIPDVARIAAEVADTAQTLDWEPPETESYPQEVPLLAHEREPASDLEKVPLFAHECVGLHEDDEIAVGQDAATRDHFHREDDQDLYDPEQCDLNDPTLERFPANRDQIMDTVRKMESGLNEDRTSFEGVPPSPVIGQSRRDTNEIFGDPFLTSPTTSPVVSRAPKRLGVPRASQGSMSSDRSSAVSLSSIKEDEEKAAGEEAAGSLVILPSPDMKPVNYAPKPPESDEDEAVIMKDRKSKPRTVPKSGSLGPPMSEATKTEPASPETPAAGPVQAIAQPTTIAGARAASGCQETPVREDVALTDAVVPENAKAESPQIVVYSAETRIGPGKSNQEPVGGKDPSDTVKTSNRETGSSNQVRKEPAPPNGGETQTSVRSTSREADKSDNWFRALLRLLFVDWVGRFVSGLPIGRRQVLLTAGVTALAVGIAWLRARSRGQNEPQIMVCE